MKKSLLFYTFPYKIYVKKKKNTTLHCACLNGRFPNAEYLI